MTVPFPAAPSLADKFGLETRTQSGASTTINIRFSYFSLAGSLHRFNFGLGRFEQRVRITCSDPSHPDHGRMQWRAVAPPDPAILIPLATKTATEQIDLPHPVISPTGDVAVNLGMWLAVEEAGPYTARAAFSDTLWAETTAALATTTFDPGDGTPPIVCAGHGTPIPDPNLPSTAPGPCGFVYTDVGDVGPHTMTITSTWTVTWRLSNGQTGQLADIATAVQHDFDVFEVQTVGVSG